MMPFKSRIAEYSRQALRRLNADSSAAAAVEFALVVPVLIAFLAVAVMAGNAYEIQRKVNMAMRTLTDLATQQSNIGTTLAAPNSAFTYSNLMAAAGLVIAPFDSSNTAMVLTGITTNASTTGTVAWSVANSHGTALGTGAAVPVPTNLTGLTFLVQGTVTYSFAPLGVFYPTGTITLSNTIYMAPRLATVACCI